jgi:hypothetical protein
MPYLPANWCDILHVNTVFYRTSIENRFAEWRMRGFLWCVAGNTARFFSPGFFALFFLVFLSGVNCFWSTFGEVRNLKIVRPE